MVLESQLTHKFVKLLLTITNEKKSEDFVGELPL